MKNASTKENEKPDWLITYQNSIGSNNPMLSNNTAVEDDLKQGSTENTEKSNTPDWLITSVIL